MFLKLKELFLPKKVKNKSQIPLLFKDYNSQRPETKQNTFCLAPSVNLYFSWEGKVIACCYNQKFILGTYPEMSIQEIWQSEKVKELRKSLENFDLSKGCDVCLKGIVGKRNTSVNALRFDEYEVSDYPKMMEFQLTNTCNLQCIMCSGLLSSSIRKNRDKLPPLPMKFGAKFIDQLVEFIPHLESTTFSGGEPFLMPIYYKIWSKIGELNPTCQINVITNGTILNNRVKNLLEKCNFNITISFDSPFKENYERIRVGASYERVLENIKYFSSYCKQKKTQLNLNFCPMTINWKEIIPFVELCNSLEASLFFSVVYDPWYLSISKLSKKELIFISKSFEEQIAHTQLPNNENLKKLKSIMLLIKRWSEDSSDKTIVEIRNTSINDILYLLLKKQSLEKENFTPEENELVVTKIHDVIKAFEENQDKLHLDFIYHQILNTHDIHNYLLKSDLDFIIEYAYTESKRYRTLKVTIFDV